MSHQEQKKHSKKSSGEFSEENPPFIKKSKKSRPLGARQNPKKE